MVRNKVDLTPEIIHKIWGFWRDGDVDENDILNRILSSLISKSPTINKELSDLKAVEISTLAVEKKNISFGVVLAQPAVCSFAPPPNFRHVAGKVRWVDDVVEALKNLGGEANLAIIYDEVEKIRKAAGRSVVASLGATVRQTVEAHSSDSKNYREGNDDLFTWVGRGRWKLK